MIAGIALGTFFIKNNAYKNGFDKNLTAELSSTKTFSNCNNQAESLNVKVVDATHLMINSVISNIDKTYSYVGKQLPKGACTDVNLTEAKLYQTSVYDFVLLEDKKNFLLGFRLSNAEGNNSFSWWSSR